MQIEPGSFIYMESYNNQRDVGYKFSIEKSKMDNSKKVILQLYSMG